MQPPWGARRHPQGRPLFDDPSPPETAEEKFEYGSRRADQAAQKLQSLGAMVYPPTNQETFDWGILAGVPFSTCLLVSCLPVWLPLCAPADPKHEDGIMEHVVEGCTSDSSIRA